MHQPKYQCHKTTNVDELLQQLQRPTIESRIYVEKVLKIVAEYLDEHNIKDTCNIAHILKEFRLKNPAIINFIMGFIKEQKQKAKEQHLDDPLPYFSRKELREMRIFGKECTIGMLCDKYYDDFIKYTPRYINEVYSFWDTSKRNKMITSICRNADEIHNASMNYPLIQFEEFNPLEFHQFEFNLSEDDLMQMCSTEN